MDDNISIRQLKLKNQKMFGEINLRKSVTIHRRKSFFTSSQFSSAFPKKLSGIIHPDDFQQSIANINRACRLTICEKLLIIGLFLCSLIGLSIFITGISAIWLPFTTLFMPLMSLGFLVFMIFFMIAIFVSSRIYRSCDTRLDKAVDMESMKYSMKLAVPIKWRLDMTIYTRRYSMASPTNIQYYLLIDIGEKTGSEIGNNAFDSNSNLSKPTLYTNQQFPTHSSPDSSVSATKSSDVTFHIDKQEHIDSSA